MQYEKDTVTCIDCLQRSEVWIEAYGEMRFFTCPHCECEQEVFDDPVIVTLDDDTATVGGGWWNPEGDYRG